MSSSMIGKLVWRGWNGILRIGRVIGSEPKEDGWTYYQIEWYEDAPFQVAKKEGLAHERQVLEERTGWYRCDSVYEVEPTRLEQALLRHYECGIGEDATSSGFAR